MKIDFPIVYIDDPEELKKVVEKLKTGNVFALDLEADVNLHRYGRKLCLAQIWDGITCWLIDLKLLNIDSLKPVLENAEITKVMYAASFDISLLSAILGIELKGLFDIQAVSSILGNGRRSLKHFMKVTFDLDLEKDLQTSDWYKRPLSEEQIIYAALDVRYLLEARELLIPLLEEADLMEAAVDNFHKVEQTRFQEVKDPYLRVRNASRLTPYEKIYLKEFYSVREKIAAEKDLPSYKVMRSYHLTGLAQNPPFEKEDIESVDLFKDKLIPHIDEFIEAALRAKELILKLNSKVREQIIELRHLIHKHPDLPGKESPTEKRINRFIRNFSPHQTLRNMGRNSSAYIYSAEKEGPVIIFRAGIDAGYGKENTRVDWISREKHTAHLYGHDGHIAILIALASRLYETSLERGKVILLFQSATSNGKGALKVLKDKRFKQYDPDFLFSLQDLPGFSAGKIVLSKGCMTPAVTKMIINLKKQNQTLESPSQLVETFMEIIKILYEQYPDVEVNNLQLGKNITVSVPQKAEIRFTLVSRNDNEMESRLQELKTTLSEICKMQEIHMIWQKQIYVPAGISDSESEEFLKKVLTSREFVIVDDHFDLLDDIGYYSDICKVIRFGLSTGKERPALGSSEYDFPDELISEGLEIYTSILKHLKMI